MSARQPLSPRPCSMQMATRLPIPASSGRPSTRLRSTNVSPACPSPEFKSSKPQTTEATSRQSLRPSQAVSVLQSPSMEDLRSSAQTRLMQQSRTRVMKSITRPGAQGWNKSSLITCPIFQEKSRSRTSGLQGKTTIRIRGNSRFISLTSTLTHLSARLSQVWTLL